MGVGTNVGVKAEGHTCCFPFSDSQFIDDLQFGNTLNIEAEDIVVESEIDFPVSLSNTGIHYFRCRKTCTQAGLYLSTAHAVCTKFILANHAQHLWIGICFYCIVYLESIMLLHLCVNGTESLSEQLCIIVIERCLDVFQLFDWEFSFCHYLGRVGLFVEEHVAETLQGTLFVFLADEEGDVVVRATV